MLRALKDCHYDPEDPKFDCLSNFSKFSSAKNSGAICKTFKELLEFLRFEMDHQDRLLVKQRLLSLAFSKYKEIVAKEVLDEGKGY